jgi:hypothetical protein
MKPCLRTGASLLCLFVVGACNAVFGPPGSEPESALPPPGFSQRYDKFIEGEPDLRAIGVRGGYYIWKVGNFWHVRLVKFDRLQRYPGGPRYSGNITVENGFIRNLIRQNTNPLDQLGVRSSDVSFSFELKYDREGFDFMIQPVGVEYCVSMDLVIEGMTGPDLVHLGRTMFIPNALPIRMCFH